ncbi:hypothetical protein BCR44DRAFT_58498 [Catenaria anguillulae PL171]|uniref:Uncharacterized protein n=1 Tax=Catenaria anguillulae PL171 TaxID=765915 RepID=A0A1Y2H7T9_9FUNG|nr:hypothetical protein BCR44DRAFT_58498 [Catenaria anguillulae PL171]
MMATSTPMQTHPAPTFEDFARANAGRILQSLNSSTFSPAADVGGWIRVSSAGDFFHDAAVFVATQALDPSNQVEVPMEHVASAKGMILHLVTVRAVARVFVRTGARVFIESMVSLRPSGLPSGARVAHVSLDTATALQLFLDCGAATAKTKDPHATHFTLYNPLSADPTIAHAAQRDVHCLAAAAEQSHDSQGLHLVRPVAPTNEDRYAAVSVGTPGQLLDRLSGPGVDEVAKLAALMLTAVKTSMRGSWIRAGVAVFPPLAWAVCPADPDKVSVSFSLSRAAFEIVPGLASTAHQAPTTLPPAAEASAFATTALSLALAPVPAPNHPKHMDFESEHP